MILKKLKQKRLYATGLFKSHKNKGNGIVELTFIDGVEFAGKSGNNIIYIKGIEIDENDSPDTEKLHTDDTEKLQAINKKIEDFNRQCEYEKEEFSYQDKASSNLDLR